MSARMSSADAARLHMDQIQAMVPSTPVYVAGTAIRSVLFWAPTSGHIGMSVSIYSYRGEVTIGLMGRRRTRPRSRAHRRAARPRALGTRADRLWAAPRPASGERRVAPASDSRLSDAVGFCGCPGPAQTTR